MDYILIRSKRKTACIQVDDNLQVVVRAPFFVPKNELDNFVNTNEAAILKMIEQKKGQLEHYNMSDNELVELCQRAERIISEKVERYSSIMNLYPTGIRITKAKKRFGSCSGKNSLCFSCYLMLYPDAAIDYVVVHELAHIKHHNHSKEFYALISEYMPDYKQREKLLKKI